MPEIEILYQKANEYRTISVTGGTGSVSPSGLVQCELYAEKLNVLENFILEVDEQGRAKEGDRAVNSFIREAQVCLLMDPNSAVSLGEWLKKKGQEALGRPTPGDIPK